MEIKKPDYLTERPAHSYVPRKRLCGKEQAAKMLDLQRRIARSPRDRMPSKADVETYWDSYHKLGLQTRLGPCPEKYRPVSLTDPNADFYDEEIPF